MDKIIAAVEGMDINTGYHLPNSVAPDYFMHPDLTQRYPVTLGKHMFDWTKGDETSYVYHTNCPYTNVEYFPAAEITGKYLYIITVYYVDYFDANKDTGFKFVNPKVLDDVRSGKCQIVFTNTTEGLSGGAAHAAEFDFVIIENWCKEYNLNTKLVHYITGNLLGTKTATRQNCTFNVHSVTVQESWNRMSDFPDTVTKFEPTSNNFLYLSYNRQPRFHRVLLLAKLLAANLFDKGLNSFNSMDKTYEWFGPVFANCNQSDVYPYLKPLFDNSPIVVDQDNSDITTSAGALANYTQTFLSVITETLVETGTLFCSEKTWRSIIVGHPFIILASPGMLAYLRSQGFKTFSPWINEDYDTKEDQFERIECIVSELDRLSKLSIDELKTIREQVEPILIYNKEVMRQRLQDKYFYDGIENGLKPIEDVLTRIWNTFPTN